VSVSEEIRASAAAHRDLGPGYEAAVAEGLVERIGEEIDRRIDARLYGHVRSGMPAPQPVPQPTPTPPPPRQKTGIGVAPVFLALGSMGMGIGASGVVLHPGWQGGSGGMGVLVALIWIVIGAINIAYARRR
jgi:hypothetical protein